MDDGGIHQLVYGNQQQFNGRGFKRWGRRLGCVYPNVGSFTSGGSGFDSFGGFGIGSDRGGFGDSSFALDRGGGGGGGWGAFQPSDDGFTNSEPLSGYAGTTPNYDSITNLERVTDGALEPMTRTDHRLGENYKNNHPWLWGPEE